MSESDFNARFPSVFTAFTLRELSNSESTASCNIRFSLRRITSGALISLNRFNRLLRMITRGYKSLRSEVSKRPPSNGTTGRSRSEEHTSERHALARIQYDVNSSKQKTK